MENEIEIESAKWASSLILYVIGETPTIKDLNTDIANQWKVSHPPEIFYHSEGYFVIRFKEMEDRNRVLYSGPYTIANKPVIVKPWEMDFDFQKEALRMVPIWIQFPNLPLNCWGMNSLSRIGSTLGTPLLADECTASQTRLSYARLLIEIDLTQPIKHNIVIEGSNGRTINQKVVYEWEPIYCKRCTKAGHDCGVSKPVERKKKAQEKWVPRVQAQPDSELHHEKEARKTNEWTIPRRTVAREKPETSNPAVVVMNTYEMLHMDPVIEPVIPNPLIDKGKLPMQEGGDLIPSGAG
uniref:DUF4283 domain-containing protein n=1 Tax=Chenopodium quinoa TaxID=63459 RepID=A0A803N8Z5_CHEQI